MAKLVKSRETMENGKCKRKKEKGKMENGKWAIGNRQFNN
jgi:hypothetical protein